VTESERDETPAKTRRKVENETSGTVMNDSTVEAAEDRAGCVEGGKEVELV